jgi:hypothetical protein
MRIYVSLQQKQVLKSVDNGNIYMLKIVAKIWKCLFYRNLRSGKKKRQETSRLDLIFGN